MQKPFKFRKKMLAIWNHVCYNILALRKTRSNGGIAQLGERLNGIQEVSGSIPLISTKKTLDFT